MPARLHSVYDRPHAAWVDAWFGPGVGRADRRAPRLAEKLDASDDASPRLTTHRTDVMFAIQRDSLAAVKAMICHQRAENLDSRPADRDWIVMLMRTSAEPAHHCGLSPVRCPLDGAGVAVRPIPMMSDMHDDNEVVFADALTSADRHMAGMNEPLRVAMTFHRGNTASRDCPRSHRFSGSGPVFHLDGHTDTNYAGSAQSQRELIGELFIGPLRSRVKVADVSSSSIGRPHN